jgi:hypothetical protein
MVFSVVLGNILTFEYYFSRYILLIFHSLLMIFPFQIHIVFCIWSAVSPPFPFKGKSFAGLLPAIDLIGNSVIVGIFYFVGFGLFVLESLLSIVVIQQVYMYFRGSGKAAQMRQEAARGAMRSAF